VGRVNMINEPTGSGRRWLSIMVVLKANVLTLNVPFVSLLFREFKCWLNCCMLMHCD
jgi:hypothetical protein